MTPHEKAIEAAVDALFELSQDASKTTVARAAITAYLRTIEEAENPKMVGSILRYVFLTVQPPEIVSGSSLNNVTWLRGNFNLDQIATAFLAAYRAMIDAAPSPEGG